MSEERQGNGEGASREESWEAQWQAAASGGDSVSGRPPRPTRRVTVDTTQARKICRKQGCGVWSNEKHPIYRHHMGCDSYVGIWNRGILYNYGKYLDCVELCEEHHCEIHYIYEPYLAQWVNRTPEGAKVMRTKLIEVCNKWLVGTIPSPKVPKAYSDKFHRKLLEWQKTAAKQGTG